MHNTHQQQVKRSISPRVMLADTLHRPVQILRMPVSKERIQTESGAARTEPPKVAVAKWPFLCAPFSWNGDLYRAGFLDSGIHSDAEYGRSVRPHLKTLLSKFQFSIRSVAKVMPFFQRDRKRARTDGRTVKKLSAPAGRALLPQRGAASVGQAFLPFSGLRQCAIARFWGFFFKT